MPRPLSSIGLNRPPGVTAPRGAIALVAVVIAVLVVGAAIGRLHEQVRAANASRASLLSVRVGAADLNALEWQAIARRQVTAAQLALGVERFSAMQGALDRVAKRGRSDRRSVKRLSPVLSRYGISLGRELSLLRSRRVAAAVRVDGEVVDPAFTRLSAELARFDAQLARRARHADAVSTIATWAILVLTALLGVATTIVSRRARRRRAADLSDRVRLETRIAAETAAAVHDNLTGLLNRRGLEEAPGEHGGLLLLDVDRLKDVNDALGHAVGDALLEQVASRIAAALADDEQVARVAGDTFAVLMRSQREPDEADLLLRGAQIAGALTTPFEVEGITLEPSVTIGAAHAFEGSDRAELLRRADLALQEAKRDGSGPVLYLPAFETRSAGRLALAAQLRGAIDRDELVVFYQPQACLTTGDVVGAEALVRWQHPEHGLLGPGEFLPFAESTGLMHELTRRVLGSALRQRAQWAREGFELTVSVNVDRVNLLDAGFPEAVAGLLDESGVPAHALQIEVTETVLMSDLSRAGDVLAELRGLGVAISLDDFGTGHSSLSHLQRLAVDEIKIDRSFVSRLESNAGDAIIVAATIDMARKFGLRTVAEGIETPEAWALLRDGLCDVAQGYLLSRPLPADQLTAWLMSERDLPARRDQVVLLS